MYEVSIVGTGSYVPENIITNIDLFPKITNFEYDKAVLSLEKKGTDVSQLNDAEVFDAWVKQVTGISQRPYLADGLGDENSSVEFMANKASIAALEDAGKETGDIDHIIFSTYTADNVIPGPVCKLAHYLGVENVSGITLNGACSGFLDALIDAYIKVGSGLYETILVVASEYISNKIDFSDPTTAILFSDGAGAAVVTKGKRDIYGFSSRIAFSDEHIKMQRTSCIQMGGGPLVQRKAVNAMSSVSNDVCTSTGIALSDITCVIPHQANYRILQALEKKMKLSENSRLVKCLGTTGNLSSATLPVAMDLLKKNKLDGYPYTGKSKTILTSVGGGYTFSAVLVDF
jgi:3-oxoacyl-[acyl-carrier-protein] synthase-3